MDVIIRQAGLLTTVQDGGRYGYQQYGVMVSGAMDQKSMRLANLLVGNEPDEAVLEMTALGADLEFQTDCIVAAVGADMQPVIGKMPVEMGVAILVRKGETIRFQAAKHGCRTYLSFAGVLICQRSWEAGQRFFVQDSADTKGESFARAMSSAYVRRWEVFPIGKSGA